MKYNTSNETAATLDMLHSNSLLSTQILSVDLKNNLQIIETSLFKQRCVNIPLTLIDSKPVIKLKPDNHILFLSIISLLTSGVFLFTGVYSNQLWAFSLSTILLVFSIMALLASYKNSTKLYCYNSKMSNTSLFLIQEPSFTKDKQVEIFVKALNNRITKLNEMEQYAEKEMIITHNSSREKSLYNDNKKSQFTKNLDFLFNHGIIDNDLHNLLNSRISQKISDAENRFNMEDKKERLTANNVIQFPLKA